MKFSLLRVVGVRLMAIAGLAVILAACGGSISNSSTSIAAGLNLDFTASLLNGSPITLGEQLAQQPVALWFWAPG